MKKDIHPQVHTNTKVTCACGNSFETMSTLEEITVDLCNMCHPFYTGQQKYVDTEGRIEKFEKKRKIASEAPIREKKSKKAKSEDKPETPQTLKDILSQVQSH